VTVAHKLFTHLHSISSQAPNLQANNMTEVELEKILLRQESTHLEYKSKIDSSYKIARTIAAFANTSGGTLLIGINDDRTVKGCSEVEEITKLSEAAELLVDPPLSLQYRSIKYGGKKTVLIIKIDESPEKPHKVLDEEGEKTVYVRANDQTTPVGKEMTQLLKKNETNVNESLLMQNNVKYLLMYLKKNRRITAKEYAKLVNISETRAKKFLESLTYEGILLILKKEKPPQFVCKF
jgi:predicted HTH transcriptional regulator